MFKIYIFLFLIFFNCHYLLASENITNSSNLFVSLRSNEVNLRVGPGNEYPIKYVYKIKAMPLKVLGEYEGWYKVVDKDNDEGWVSKNLTMKARYVIVKNGTQILYKKDDLESNPIFRLEENVVAKLDKCKKNWCKVEVNDKSGWLESKNIWGI